jgi:PPM family protein phosphatase
MNSQLEIVSVSDTGRRRPHNEDSTATVPGHGLAVLADGMGGYKAGEVASALAVMIILQDFVTGLKGGVADDPRDEISRASLTRKAINHANSDIYTMAHTEAECQGMGTTVVTGLIYGDKITIGNVGDSRLYRLRSGELRQLTKDHSLIQELIDRGLYTPEEAVAHAPKNLVTRALGLELNVEIDIFEEKIERGDIYLLCSDGLNDMVTDEEILLILSKYSANLLQAAEELVHQANSNGGLDNISVVLLMVKEIAPLGGGQLQRFLNRLVRK